MTISRLSFLEPYYRRRMKWPEWLIMIRHDESAYNEMKIRRALDSRYKEFSQLFRTDPSSNRCYELACQLNEAYKLGVSDQETPLVKMYSDRVINTASNLREREEKPDVIFVSPYLRTWQTYEGFLQGWPELRSVKVVEEERIREQSHGLADIFSDWKIFLSMNPDQKRLYDLEGQYWFKWPQGENCPVVRDRNRSWITTMARDYSGKKCLAFSHQLSISCIRANFERWGAAEFIRVDTQQKPKNCGVTKYAGNPMVGKHGHFELQYYNEDMSIAIAA